MQISYLGWRRSILKKLLILQIVLFAEIPYFMVF